MAPGWRVAGLFASCVVGCGDDGSPPRGLPSGTTSGADASSSVAAAEASSSTSGAEPDEMPSLDACEAAGVSVCGDGILQAPESCDGTPGCEDCASPPEVRPWGDPVQADTLDVAGDGAVAVLRTEDPQTRLYLLAPGGTTEAVVGVDVPLSHLRWVGHDLIVWGGGDVLGFGPSGEERWRMHWPDTAFSTGQASADVIVLGGQWQPVHSPSTRGLVVVLGSDGEVRFEAPQGDLRAVGAVARVGEDVVLSGPYGDDENRAVVRRLGPDGASQWTDGGLWWTATPVAIWPQGTATWAISKDGTAVLHDADGVRVQSVPCLGAVDGHILQVAVGPKPALAFGLHPVDGERSWWVRAGSPTGPTRGWASADSIGAMAWTPRGSLLVALDGEPRLMEVAL